MPRYRLEGWIAAAGMIVAASEPRAHTEDAAVGRVLELTWSGDPWVVVPLFLCIGLYGSGWHRLAYRSRRGLRRAHAGAFLAGCAVLAIALVSPLDALGGQLFSAHMLQHEALMLIAAPLLVWSKPLGVLAWGVPHGWARRIAVAFTNALLQRVWRWLALPVTAWSLHALALWVWHAPVLFQASLRSDAIHAWQHASFLLSALLFWWALLRRTGHVDPVLYVFTTLLHTGVLGMLLTFSTSAWYPFYLDTAPRWGLTALEDQQLGGLIMWVPAGAVLTAAALAMFGHWLGGLPRATAPSASRNGRRS